jgi:hypothetical protein
MVVISEPNLVIAGTAQPRWCSDLVVMINV